MTDKTYFVVNYIVNFQLKYFVDIIIKKLPMENIPLVMPLLFDIFLVVIPSHIMACDI
jgi:hypothetical protein